MLILNSYYVVCKYNLLSVVNASTELPHALKRNLLLSFCCLALILRAVIDVSSSYTSWLYLSGVFPRLEIAEVLDAHFEPVDWERCSYPEGIESILSLFIL